MEEYKLFDAEYRLMELVWNNLLSNALKFTEPGGSVILRQTSDTDQVTVSVSDTGCGISQEAQNHIFDKFYQGIHPTQQRGTGWGWLWRSGSCSLWMQPLP